MRSPPNLPSHRRTLATIPVSGAPWNSEPALRRGLTLSPPPKVFPSLLREPRAEPSPPNAAAKEKFGRCYLDRLRQRRRAARGTASTGRPPRQLPELSCRSPFQTAHRSDSPGAVGVWVRGRPQSRKGRRSGWLGRPGLVPGPPGGCWLSPESRSEAGAADRQTHILAQVTGLRAASTHPRGWRRAGDPAPAREPRCKISSAGALERKSVFFFPTPPLLRASEKRKYVGRTRRSREVWRWAGDCCQGFPAVRCPLVAALCSFPAQHKPWSIGRQLHSQLVARAMSKEAFRSRLAVSLTCGL